MIISYESSVVKKENTHLEFPFREDIYSNYAFASIHFLLLICVCD